MSILRKIVRVAEVTTQPVCWLPGFPEQFQRGALNVIAAPPGTGKGLLAALVAAEVSQHENVIYSSYEDSLRQVLKPRLRAAGADERNVRAWNMKLPDDLDALEGQIQADRVRLLILDTLPEHLNHSIYSPLTHQTLLGLHDVLERTDCTGLALVHPIKSFGAKSNPIQLIGGAYGGVSGVSRQIALLCPDPDDDDALALAFVKGNNAPRPNSLRFQMHIVPYQEIADEQIENPDTIAATVAFLRRDGESPLDAADAVRILATGQASTPGRALSRLEEAKEFLADYLRAGEASRNDVLAAATAWGITEITLNRAFQALRCTWRRQGFGVGGAVMWQLPNETRDAKEADPGTDNPPT